MELTISDPSSLRILSRTVQTAAKLCEHVQFTGHGPCLHFRLLTQTHSTFALFRFHPSFFSSAVLPPSAASYKLSSRLLPPLLKAPQTISSVRLTTHRDNRLCLTLQTQSGLTKRFLLPLLEGRISSVRTSPLRNTLQTTASFLSDLLANFHAKLDEITVIPSANSLTLLSFVDDTANPSNAFLRTEITVDTRQFDQHVFVTDVTPSNLTFLCRPLRTVVEYCDSLDVPIRIMYDKPACPLQLDMALPAPSGQAYFDALFIFASRVPPQLSQDPQQPQQQQQQQQQQLEPTATAPATANANANAHTNNQSQQRRQRRRQPVSVDALVRPVPVPMQTDTDQNDLFQSRQQSTPNTNANIAVAPVTPMRSARRHGQQPLIPLASQQQDAPEDDDDEDDGQRRESQQRQQESQQYVRQPLRPIAEIPTHSPSPSPTTGPPQLSTPYQPSPSVGSSRVALQQQQQHMTPISQSDPSTVQPTPIPESNTQHPSLSHGESGEAEEEEEEEEEEDYEDESMEVDENEDDEEFVEGTPPPEATQN